MKDFKKFQEKIETKTNATYLYCLFQIEYKKLTGNFYSDFFSHNIFENTKLTTEEQKKENLELSAYLSKLKKSELINEKQYLEFQKKINDNFYTYQLQLINEIANQSLKADYMSSDKLKKFANKLRDNGIVGLQYDNLIIAIENEKIENPIDFLSYCNKSVIINLNNYPTEPVKYLELIHKETAGTIPELAFTNFDFQIELDNEMPDDDSKFYNFIVSLQSNEKKYKQKSFYNLYTPSKNKYSNGKIDSQEYYKIFNKILADQHSAYRLHEVKTYNGRAINDEIFGIIALTREQEKVLQESDSYFRPSYEDFKSKPTTEQIEKAIEEYTKIGLFSHLSPTQINEAKEKVSMQENRSYNEVLSAFANMIYWYDTELSNLEDPYAELLKELAKISNNEFNPVNISNIFDIEKSKKTTLKFKIGNKSYSKTFKINDDWIDVDFFEFLKSVLVENKIKGHFYDLFTGGQDAQVVYLTKQQYDYLHENRLLVFSDQEWTDED
ncbi:hypothetical protein [Flavobacterium sp. LC2016-12]|uniref:hypothetical protein n=1 Tax=Flavobacterium sp. LC2016-12 TaxID=2783794 RepID=UPI00188C0E64|nr:hypothetical protein [Flavobacterium sp. LC2016-12]MBF4464153.1 hypothetical protein [Flavobacterium sp. LC2016-12]